MLSLKVNFEESRNSEANYFCFCQKNQVLFFMSDLQKIPDCLALLFNMLGVNPIK